MSLLVSWSSDSAGVMYRARRPSGDVAGYHRETISSRALTPAAQGSGREVSVSHKDVVPTGPGPELPTSAYSPLIRLTACSTSSRSTR